MAVYCDVALPVPLDRTFTYAVGGTEPKVGSRVIVPFSRQRLVGVVTRLHDESLPEGLEAKPVQTVMDVEPLLSNELMKLAVWTAQYYCAPLGEVLRGMLPLGAEVRRQALYSIGEAGRRVLYEGAEKGSSRRSRLPAEEQNLEYAVLNYLENGEPAKVRELRSATAAGKSLLEGMVRKKWLVREMLAEERDARRTIRVALLVPDVRVPKLNANQLTLLADLAARDGRMPVRAISSNGLPLSTLGTLVRRGLVRIEEEPELFELSGMQGHAQDWVLNEDQIAALVTISGAMAKGTFATHLLFGVTGSGKTAVYFAAMRQALAAGKGVLLLVPEIGLTPAMSGQLNAAFGGEVALLHSQLTPAERAEQWHRIRRGEARVVVGTRSAVFAPVVNLGLLIVDEEHDQSYKQEETPRYHGRDVAVMRGKLTGAVVVLGSATPSLESWANAERGRYELMEMKRRVQDRPLPAIELVDMRVEFRETHQEEIFSRVLVAEVQATLDRGEQAMILLNRRGYSFSILCRSCGERIECENCAVSLTFHKTGQGDPARGDGRLECGYCGYRRGVPATCPKCGSEHLYSFGAGSQQGEERLHELFPKARIGRMDRDTMRGRGEGQRLLSQLQSGEINLLVGTQMIAKGHDIHGVTLVGVVGADFALGLPDFRAAERVFQLITQVSGRCGRGRLPGKVLVQAYHPEHYAVRFAAAQDFLGFAAKEMDFRRSMHYPPSNVLANVILQGERLEQVAGWAAAVSQWSARQCVPGLRVSGPAPAPISRLKRIYRYHLLIKSHKWSALRSTLRALTRFAQESGIPPLGMAIDVDPISLM